MDIKDYSITKLRRVTGVVDILESLARIEHLLSQQKQQYTQELIREIKPGSILKCRINRMSILAPVEVLQVYQHCLAPSEEETLNFWVETHCADWIGSKIDNGDVVLDVGAAFGVISLPLIPAIGEKGHIYAFEPARKTQQLLQKIVDFNHLETVTVVKSAISDEPGKAEFVEYTSTNDLCWASDASTLKAPESNPSLQHESYVVDVITIDDFVATHNIKPKAIKIDIEGFELYALQGAKTTLDRYAPYLCIDIHKDVKTGESALLGVKPFLESLGYTMEMNEHTLFCSPQNPTL